MDRVLADVVMLVHFGFLVFVALGGFLAWRWPRWILAHLFAVAWGVATIAFSIPCPLTYVENHFRHRAGQPGLGPAGFIDQYLEGVVYPERYTPLIWAAVGVVVLFSWAVLLRRVATRRSAPDPRARHA
jgi:hypothetical protein